jgi:hypothetical protein
VIREREREVRRGEERRGRERGTIQDIEEAK